MIQHNPKVTFLVDDTPGPGRARAVEIRGEAELHTTGGKEINPRFPNFAEEFFWIRPTRIVSWGLEEEGGPQSATSFRLNARSVRQLGIPSRSVLFSRRTSENASTR
ncbi:MAG TPA: hypothetical protein VFE09_02315 [Rubrobacteraceae bacterium]|nr:hypothetical protein [Rubrobacteraceae bacterium]